MDAALTKDLPDKIEFDTALKNIVLNGDTRWVLSIVNTDGLSERNKKGYKASDKAIKLLADEVKELNKQSKTRIMCFEDVIVGKSGAFGIFIRCSSNSDTSYAVSAFCRSDTSMMESLKEFNIRISVGLSFLQKTDTQNCWLQRVLANLQRAKQNGGDQLCWDPQSNDREKKENLMTLLHDNKEFESKLTDIAESQDTKWMLVLVDGDDVGKLSKISKQRATNAVLNVEHNIAKIIDDFHKIKQNDENNALVLGYRITSDEFALLVYGKKLSVDIVTRLTKTIEKNCDVTISSGMTFLRTNEYAKDWRHRAHTSLMKAQKNGGNCYYCDGEDDQTLTESKSIEDDTNDSQKTIENDVENNVQQKSKTVTSKKYENDVEYLSLPKRIRKEIQRLEKDTTPGIKIVVDENNYRYFLISIDGPKDSVYQSGIFRLEMFLTNKYPMVPPKARFLTKIYHPGVDKLGRISMAILKDKWTPACTVNSICKQIEQELMTFPEDWLNEPLDSKIAFDWKNDVENGRKTAREWTKKYAC